MTTGEIINYAKTLSSDEQYLLSVEPLIASQLNCRVEDLFINAEMEISIQKQIEIVSRLESLLAGKPLAQITGSKHFHNYTFEVNEHVLIPRPETEELVELILSSIRTLAAKKPLKILDIGTGSGNIILTLIKELEQFDVTGVGIDVSIEALKTANSNAVNLGIETRVNFAKSDLLENIDEYFDVVVANLPYIGTQKFNFVAQNVADYEPALALYGGNDGLDYYRLLFDQYQQKKISFGSFWCEFGFGQIDIMTELLDKYYPEQYQVYNDYAGIPRIIKITTSLWSKN